MDENALDEKALDENWAHGTRVRANNHHQYPKYKFEIIKSMINRLGIFIKRKIIKYQKTRFQLFLSELQK